MGQFLSRMKRTCFILLIRLNFPPLIVRKGSNRFFMDSVEKATANVKQFWSLFPLIPYIGKYPWIFSKTANHCSVCTCQPADSQLPQNTLSEAYSIRNHALPSNHYTSQCEHSSLSRNYCLWWLIIFVYLTNNIAFQMSTLALSTLEST